MGHNAGPLVTLRQQREKAGLAGVAELGERLFDEALRFCENEREAAALASATLISRLERGRRVAAGPVAHAG